MINARLMGDHHRSLVLNLLRTKGPCSRSAIAEELGLSRSAMTRIVQRLLAEGSANEIGEVSDGGVGRRAVLIRFNGEFATTVGVHIAADHVTCALLNLDARILSRSEMVIEGLSDVTGIQRSVSRALLSLVQEDTVGIGVAVSGLVDVETGEAVYSPVLGWHDVQIREPLQEATKLPVFVENDANALALAEYLYGSGQGFHSLLCIMIGDGIGGGIILNGDLHRGASGAAGEIGHTCISLDGPICRCGEIGCLEEYCANRALLREANQSGFAGVDELAVAARKGHDKARAVFAEMGQRLALATKDAVNLLSPQAVLVGGEQMKNSDLFFERFAETLVEHVFPRGGRTPDVLKCATGEDGLLLGAAGLVSKAFLRSPVSVGRESAVSNRGPV